MSACMISVLSDVRMSMKVVDWLAAILLIVSTMYLVKCTCSQQV